MCNEMVLQGKKRKKITQKSKWYNNNKIIGIAKKKKGDEILKGSQI